MRDHLPNPARWLVRLGYRAARSVYYRSSTALSRDSWKLFRRNVLFPLRNALLRKKPIALTAGGQHFRLVPEGSVPLEKWAGRYFESAELSVLLDLLEPGMTFIDVGANVGVYSIPAALKVAKGQVIAFEPTRWTFDRLVRNAQLNNLSNIQAVHAALGDSPGEAELHVNVAGKDGLNTLGRPTHDQCEITGKERVPVLTLDSYLCEHQISVVDVMKIDVEGAELLVLRGARELLSRSDAPLILLECGRLTAGFGYHPVETLWLLQELGYCFFVVDSKTGQISVPRGDQAFDKNLLALKSTHPAYAALAGRAR